MKKKLTYEDVCKRFEEKGYTLLEKEYKSSATRMECMDADGYKYSICNNLLQNGRTSDKFGVLNPYTIYNINHYLRLNSNGSRFVSDVYSGSKSIVKITCEKCGKEMEMTWANLLKLQDFSCKNCKENPKKYKFDFIKEEFEKFGLKILDENYHGNNKTLCCLDSEGYIIKKKYTDLYKNKNPYRMSYKFNKENYIQNMNNYFNINEINCKATSIIENKDNVTWIECVCECERKFKTNIGSINRGQVRCTYCSKTMSRLEYFVRDWFDKNKIEYIFQKRFDDCLSIRTLPFDFYLPKFNCCIEVDGQQHYKPSKFSDSSDEYKEFEKRKLHDKIKTDYCKRNKIDLLRISYKDIKRKDKKYIEILSNKFINN